MADLSAMYMDLADSSGRATDRGFLGMQQIMENQLAYQKAKEDLEAQRGLRALFAQNPNASAEEVSRYSPQLGMEMNKYAQEAQERSGRMRKTQNEISEQEMKIFSVAGAQVAEKYAPAAMSGQMSPQMLSQFHNEIGNALMQVEQQYGIKPPPGMDVSRLDPMGVLSRAAPFYKSPVIENIMSVDKERMMSQIDPRKTATQAYGEYETDPVTGQLVLKPPLPSDGGKPKPKPIPAPSFTFEGTTYTGPEFGKAILAEKDPERKRKMNEYVDATIATTRAGIPNAEIPLVGDIDRAGYKAKEAAAVETARETAKAEVTRGEEGKRITDSFKRAIGEGGVSRVMKLISESTSGPTEEFAAKVVSGVPRPGGSKATTGMENIGSLTTIAKELKKTIERSPGPQSDKDVALDALAAAAIDNASIPYNQRMKGFLEFTRIIKERADDLGIDPKEIGIDVDVNTGSSIPTAKTDAEADELVKTLKPGQSFIGPDNKTHTIKGR